MYNRARGIIQTLDVSAIHVVTQIHVCARFTMRLGVWINLLSCTYTHISIQSLRTMTNEYFWAHIIRMLLTIQMNSLHISPMKNRRRHVTNLPKNEMRQHHKVWGLLFSLQHFTIEHEKSKKFTNSNCYFISNKVRTFINKTCSHSFVYCWCIALAKEFNILYQFGIPTMLLSVK